MQGNVQDMDPFALQKIAQRKQYTVHNVLKKTKQLSIVLAALDDGKTLQVKQTVVMQVAIWMLKYFMHGASKAMIGKVECPLYQLCPKCDARN